MAEDTKAVLMEQKDIDALAQKLGGDVNIKINALFAEAEKGTKGAMEELKSKFAEISTIDGKGIAEFVKAVQAHADNLEANFKALQTKGSGPKTFEQKLKDDITAFGFSRIQESVKNGLRIPMEIKTGADHSLTDNVGAGVVPLVFEPGITGVIKRQPALYDLLNKQTWSKSVVNWVEVSAQDNADIAAKGEAAASGSPYDASYKFGQVDYTTALKSMTLSKVPAYAKVTQEMVEDIDDFVQFIKSELVKDVLLALDAYILSGNGSAPIMKGLQHADYHTDAAIPGGFEMPSGIVPSNVHVLRAIITQMENLYLQPNVILMHPTDIMKLDLAVDSTGQFILPPFANRENTNIKGVPIVGYAGLTAGQFHVLDTTRISLFIQRGLSLKLWDQVGSDPLYDLMTMTASVKAGVRVKTNEKGANIYGTFSTMIARMTAGGS